MALGGAHCMLSAAILHSLLQLAAEDPLLEKVGATVVKAGRGMKKGGGVEGEGRGITGGIRGICVR